MRVWVLLVVFFLGSPVWADHAEAAGRIYLLRGLANVFSTGLDTLNEQLVSRGFNSTVHNHLDYEALADEAARLDKAGKGPIIIIGHSLGADSAVSMANEMNKRGARVSLLVLFGPDYEAVVPANVARVINYYEGSSVATAGPRFKGTIRNINLSNVSGINHFNVEKIDKFHAQVISSIQTLLARSPAPAKTPSKTVVEGKVAAPHE